MAQIWLSYAELCDVIDCSTADVRDRVVDMGLDRRRSHDGLTRVKLTEQLAERFMVAFATQKLGSPHVVAGLQDRLSAAFAGEQPASLEAAVVRVDQPSRRAA
jgi:diaminopimelate epimerase